MQKKVKKHIIKPWSTHALAPGEADGKTSCTRILGAGTAKESVGALLSNHKYNKKRGKKMANHRKPLKAKKDAKVFRKTAVKHKKINTNAKSMRGGIRL